MGLLMKPSFNHHRRDISQWLYKCCLAKKIYFKATDIQFPQHLDVPKS